MQLAPLSSLAILLALLIPVHSLRAAPQEQMEYQVCWMGTTVGTMFVESEQQADGTLLRSIRVKNSAWVSRISSVDTTIQCSILATSAGPRHTVSKHVSENGFVQNDTLTLWPDSGRAIWFEAIAQTCTTSSLPPGTRDIVSFFFDMRETFAAGSMKTGEVYRLVMDGQAHELAIQADAVETISSLFGRQKATPLHILSKSPTLFVRNRPRRVWVAVDSPVVLATDVKTRLGTVRIKLIKWTRDGECLTELAAKQKQEDPGQN